MKPNRKTIEDILSNHIRSAPRDAMESDSARVLDRLRAQERDLVRTENVRADEPAPVSSPWRRFAVAAATAALVVAGILIVLEQRNNLAVVESRDGTRHRLRKGTIVRAEGGTTTVSVRDGSNVEMKTNSELSMQTASDGISIRLNDGSIIVRAAKQGAGHLYVQTKDAVVSVVGTVFLVSAEREGTRVAVIEGEVSVRQQNTSTKLRPGEESVTSPFLAPRVLTEQIAWSGHAAEYAALLQDASVPVRFEVASIRPSPYKGQGMIGTLASNKTLNSYHQPVQELILYAYDMKDFQLSGGPAWVYNRDLYGKDVYDIIAKAESDSIPTPLQFRRMMQDLLADRFKLVVRHATKEVSSYQLVVAPKGSKLKEGSRDLEESPAVWAASGTESTVEARRVPISYLIGVLKTATGQPVLDKTGLTGTYAFTLHYAEREAKPGTTTAPLVLDAVQEQLGLKLEPIKERFDTLVIEQVERPSEN